MIDPSDIEKKATRLYATYIRAWLADENSFFPASIPCNKRPDSHLPSAIRQVRALRDASKEVIGYGFTVEWQEVNSRAHGRNLFPVRISFDTEADLLQYVRKEREFRVLTKTATLIRAAFPELRGWVRSSPRVLLEIADDLDGLIEVTHYLQRHPRPGCFARELPLKVDTKFVDRHQRLLREWLDLVLSPTTIRADEDHFERRYGLSYIEHPVLVRALDPVVQQLLSLPCQATWLPLHSLDVLERPHLRVIVVENAVNLMTLPLLSEALAMGGMGNSVLLLRYAPWLRNIPFTYWGDLDAEGFEILSRLRAHFPNVQSVMMDIETIEKYRHLVGKGNDRAGAATPPHLTPSESHAFVRCVQDGLRLEQERIPHADCVDCLTQLLQP